MNDRVDAHGVEVSYRSAEPKTITVTGRHPDGDYTRSTDYTFRMEGATAVLSGLNPDDDSYQVRLAEEERAAVKDTVTSLPFVQAVVMFSEVDA